MPRSSRERRQSGGGGGRKRSWIPWPQKKSYLKKILKGELSGVLCMHA